MKKEKLLFWLNIFVNEINLSDVELMYGKGTVIKFNSVDETFSKSNPILFFDLTVIFGDKFDEELLDSSLIELLIKKFVNQFDSKYSIALIIKWDV